MIDTPIRCLLFCFALFFFFKLFRSQGLDCWFETYYEAHRQQLFLELWLILSKSCQQCGTPFDTICFDTAPFKIIAICSLCVPIINQTHACWLLCSCWLNCCCETNLWINASLMRNREISKQPFLICRYGNHGDIWDIQNCLSGKSLHVYQFWCFYQKCTIGFIFWA